MITGGGAGIPDVAFVAFMAALGMAFVAGARVALTARRTPTAPERWIGFSVLALVAGAIVEGASGFTTESPELARASGVVYRGAYAVSAAALYLAVWRTFRPESRWALALAFLGSIATAAWAVRRQMDWDAERLESTAWMVAELARAGPFAWASFESFRYASRVRRRASIGLGDPDTARRFLLWGIAAAAGAVLMLIAVTLDDALGVEVLSWPPTLIAMSLLCLVAAVAVHGAHFPRHFDRRWLGGGARILELADRLLPQPLREGRADQLRRARLILVAAACALIWTPPIAIYLIRAGAQGTGAGVAAFGALIAAAPLVLRATASVQVAANLVLLGLGLMVMNSVLAGSGIYSSTLPWLLLLPAGALLLAGPRSGAAWSIAALAGIWWIYFVGASDGTGLTGLSGTHPIIRAINLTAMLSVLTTVAFSSVRQQERALGEARLASEAKSQFLAAMSHEIRTPLNGVLGMAQLLLETNPTAKQRELSETIRSSGETLLTLLNEILDLSRIEAGRVEIAQIDFDPGELLADVERIVEKSTSEKGLALAFSVAPELSETLRGDPDRLRQVLINLVSNAVKFTDRGGVEVRVESRGEPGPDGIRIVRFDVADTGIGIPPEDVERIFDRFAQLDQSSTRRHGGTGLGLTIAKQLVEMMDGEIGVESRPGQGSRFWFRLPVQTADPTHPRTQDSTGKAGPEKPTAPLLCAPEEPTSRRNERLPASARVLLVEDNPVNQCVAAGMLEALGYSADIADDGREGLRAACRPPYDVILMDCQMPHMDGFEITRRIRRLEQSRPEPGDSPHEPVHVPIIALTAAAFPEDRERCLAAGMDDYLAKPFELEQLAEVLARWLSGAAPAPTDASEPAQALPSGSCQTFLERERLAEIRALDAGGKSGLLERVIGAYFDSTPGLLESMTDAIDKGDGGALANAAHTLKSSSAALGALRLSELCKELEALGRAGSTTGAATLLTELGSEFVRVQRALADESSGSQEA